MTPDQFTRRADAIAINSDIHRTYIHAFIGFVVAIGVLGGFVLTWEHQLKREALATQESLVKW